MLALLLFGLGALNAADLPAGAAPPALEMAHFPDRLHAFVWLNWSLVPASRMAAVTGADPEQLGEMARRMGLPEQPALSPEIARRAYITIIRRNWHLLPYEQLLALLEWTPEELAYTLREDDFLYIKLGSLKPRCETLRYAPPDENAVRRAEAIGAVVRETFPAGLDHPADPLFGFVARLAAPPEEADGTPDAPNHFSPRYCASYFALYGDPLLGDLDDSFPEGYLERLHRSGADGVWIQAVLYRLAPFPWEPEKSAQYEKRLENLARLVDRARAHGLGVYLYLNEPRAMPVPFFDARGELRGVTANDHATLCTSTPEVRQWLRDSVETVCRAVPGLAGLFTISGSENLTHCWSHGGGAACPRCGGRGAAAVISDLHAALREGMDAAGSAARLIAWDWGWADGWVPEIAENLPESVTLMSVSEWNLPIERGGVKGVVGEYSISAIGPGPRAAKHWELARAAGRPVMAKVQATTTWEIGSMPYIPAVRNVAEHAARLRAAGITGLMLSWTLGGCPSPNMDVFAEIGRMESPDPGAALRAVAARRYGPALAPAAAAAWEAMSAAFSEYPYHIGTVYSGPQHMGPANPLWPAPTGYAATMVGFPYDALDAWRAIYPPEIFAAQFDKVADGFDAAVGGMAAALENIAATEAEKAAFRAEMTVAEACAAHFHSVANQTRFVVLRGRLADAADMNAAAPLLRELEEIIRDEERIAARLYALQTTDSRIGYEASNHYFYVPLDLAAKVINCRDLLDRWLPEQRARFSG